jgi:hypothetical protein
MKAVHRSRVLSYFLIAAYLLGACRGVPLEFTYGVNTSPLLDVSPMPGFAFARFASQVENHLSCALEAISVKGSSFFNGMVCSPVSFGRTGNVLLVGRQVKLHGLISADGKLGVREIEKSVSPLEDHSIWSGSEHGHNHHSDDDCHAWQPL